MKIKIFYPNRDGMICLTKQELEKLLDEVYNEGYHDGRQTPSITWTTPYYNNITTTPYLTTSGTTTGNQYTITATNVNDSCTTFNNNTTTYTTATSGQVLSVTDVTDYVEYSKLNVSYMTK